MTSCTPENCTDLVQPVDGGLGNQIKISMNNSFLAELEDEERCDLWFDGEVSAGERRVLLTKWLGDAQDNLDPKLIRSCFKKTGCCLDMNGKENHLVELKNLKTFTAPKKGAEKMQKLTQEEIEAWQQKEIDFLTKEIKKMHGEE